MKFTPEDTTQRRTIADKNLYPHKQIHQESAMLIPLTLMTGTSYPTLYEIVLMIFV
jgi:hypothetical protein